MKINEKIAIMWLALSCIALTFIMLTYNTTVPFFTYIFLIVSLATVIKNRNAESVGFTKVKWKKLITTTIMYFVASAIIIVVIEYTTESYRHLLGLAIGADKGDPTFLWLTEYEGVRGLLPMFLVSSFITIFAEEIFFRGLLLQKFRKKFKTSTAILIQAILFSLPHIIAALLMPITSGFALVIGYGVIIYGVLGGIAATKTNSFWPGLIVANLNNLLITVFYL